MSRNNREIELYPTALTIAGSDSGGGAGIEADLRTFNAFGVYGCVALTAVTSQNPLEVRRVDPVPAAGVRCQIETVMDRIPVRFAKSGILCDAAIVDVVAEVVEARGLRLVCDPVMVSTSGVKLLADDAVERMRNRLIPAADWVTPNIPEAELLLGRRLAGADDYRDAALECYERWGVSVLLKTGHARGGGKSAVDFVCRDGEVYQLSSPRIPDAAAASHGTGCTLSAALAAAFALELPWEQALCEAKGFVLGSLREAVWIAPEIPAMYPPVEDSVGQVRLEPATEVH